MPELTVRENIAHSARIRLPSSWTNRECQQHVDILLECLGLSHVQHNPVGDTIHSTISGGQRKRVSIGLELAAAPVALFLDEPTSGLDSTSALSIIRLLKALSEMGVTVICIVHQPRMEIFDSLDNIALLAGGKQLYHGRRDGLVDYFDQAGYLISGCPNPADAIMDIVCGHGTVYYRSTKSPMPSELASRWEAHEKHAAVTEGEVSSSEQMSALLRSAAIRGTSWPLQVRLCLVRAMKQQHRQPSSFYLEISVGAIAGLLIGLSLYQLKGLHFQGMYRDPFGRLSSAVNYTLVPQIGLLNCLAIGKSNAPYIGDIRWNGKMQLF